jgi:predicted ATPase
MIQKVHIQNFKSLRDVSIDLERFTVFVGANGSGKTSVLEAISYAVLSAMGASQKVFAHERHGDWLYTRGGVGDLFIQCEAALDALTVEATPPNGYPPPPEMMQKEKWEYRVSPEGPKLPYVLQSLGRMKFLRLDATALAKPSYSRDDPPRLKHTGEGLASALAHLALNDPQAFENLVDAAQRLIPRLRGIRFRKAKVYLTEKELVRFGRDTLNRSIRRPYQGELILFDFEHAENVSARTASEGTLIMLGLITVLLGPIRPRVLLLDDIEHGLHPLAQKHLVQVIEQILQKYPDVQLLATAHSPYLLNYLAPEQVRIMAVGPDGYSRCGRLTDHPKFETWKEEMAPGEMWSVFGEKWLTETEVRS